MVLIRSCQLNDVQFVQQAMEELAMHPFQSDLFTKTFTQNLTNKNLHYFIAEYNGVKAGFASLGIQAHLHHEGPVAEVQELLVMPDYRSTGIGKQLLDHLVTLAQQQGCCLIELASSTARIDAHRFYVREGFTDSHHKFTRKL